MKDLGQKRPKSLWVQGGFQMQLNTQMPGCGQDMLESLDDILSLSRCSNSGLVNKWQNNPRNAHFMALSQQPFQFGQAFCQLTSRGPHQWFIHEVVGAQ